MRKKLLNRFSYYIVFGFDVRVNLTDGTSLRIIVIENGFV